MRLHIHTPVDSAVHRMHVDALSRYATESGIHCTTSAGLSGLRAVLRAHSDAVFVQSTGILNLIALPILKRRSRAIVYLLHEPSSLRTKIERGNGLLKSLAWQVMQRFDIALSDTVLVTRSELKERAIGVYGLDAAKVAIAPLLMPPPESHAPLASRRRITYLGRLDGRRYLEDFIDLADDFRSAGLEPTILTSDEAAASRLRLPATIDLIAERDFSESRKAEVLATTAVVWNPKSYDIAQSGVTVDALRYGCRVVLTDGDPECRDLLDRGIAIEYDSASVVSDSASSDTDNVDRLARSLFSHRHGRPAFDAYYLPVLDAGYGLGS